MSSDEKPITSPLKSIILSEFSNMTTHEKMCLNDLASDVRTLMNLYHKDASIAQVAVSSTKHGGAIRNVELAIVRPDHPLRELPGVLDGCRETRYASLTKVFTAAAAMNVLNLETRPWCDPDLCGPAACTQLGLIAKFLKEKSVKVSNEFCNVTIGNLLSMSVWESNEQDVAFVEKIIQATRGPLDRSALNKAQLPSVAEVVQYLSMGESITHIQMVKIGQENQYSNNDFTVLGFLLELATGQPYLDLIREQLSRVGIDVSRLTEATMSPQARAEGEAYYIALCNDTECMTEKMTPPRGHALEGLLAYEDYPLGAYLGSGGLRGPLKVMTDTIVRLPALLSLESLKKLTQPNPAFERSSVSKDFYPDAPSDGIAGILHGADHCIWKDGGLWGTRTTLAWNDETNIAVAIGLNARSQTHDGLIDEVAKTAVFCLEQEHYATTQPVSSVAPQAPKKLSPTLMHTISRAIAQGLLRALLGPVRNEDSASCAGKVLATVVYYTLINRIEYYGYTHFEAQEEDTANHLALFNTFVLIGFEIVLGGAKWLTGRNLGGLAYSYSILDTLYNADSLFDALSYVVSAVASIVVGTVVEQGASTLFQKGYNFFFATENETKEHDSDDGLSI